MTFQAKLLGHSFSKLYSMATFQDAAPISRSAVICSEMNTASITNKRLL